MVAVMCGGYQEVGVPGWLFFSSPLPLCQRFHERER